MTFELHLFLANQAKDLVLLIGGVDRRAIHHSYLVLFANMPPLSSLIAMGVLFLTMLAHGNSLESFAKATKFD